MQPARPPDPRGGAARANSVCGPVDFGRAARSLSGMFPIRDHNPSRSTPWVTWAIIAVNAAVFLSYAGGLDDPRVIYPLWDRWALIPAEVSSGLDYHTVLTSMFLHGGWMHVIGNMLFLWVFGDNMEDEFGHLGFLGFYLAAGAAAAVLHVMSDPASAIPTVGASGAIAGVMGGYLLLFPKAKVDVLFIIVILIRIIPIPAWVVLGVWFAIQFASGAMTPTEAGGVAYWAHVGGFAAGVVLTLPLFLRRGGPRFWNRSHGHPPHPAAVYSQSRVPVVPKQTPPLPNDPVRPGSPWQRSRR